MNEVGIHVYHTFNEYFSASLYSTTDNFLDYGFLQARWIKEESTYGIRLGRINIPSGLFAGYGPFSDDMNFLPQGTAPSRVGQSFYRFDGAQLYHERSLSGQSGFGVEISYGEHVITSEKGVFEPAFFAIFDGETLEAEFSKPALLLNLNYYNGPLELVLNYSDMVGSISGVYSNTFPLEILTGNPADAGMYTDISVPVTDPSYPSKLLKIGGSYSSGQWEHLLTYFRWVDTPGETFVGDTSLGSKYTSIGYTYITRYMLGDSAIVYGGYSQYSGTFGNDQITATFKYAPDWVDEGRSVIAGVKYQISVDLHVIAESHFNKGGIYLSGEYQDPVTAKEYWSLHSLTLNFVF
jgi:hypothetical protein